MYRLHNYFKLLDRTLSTVRKKGPWLNNLPLHIAIKCASVHTCNIYK